MTFLHSITETCAPSRRNQTIVSIFFFFSLIDLLVRIYTVHHWRDLLLFWSDVVEISADKFIKASLRNLCLCNWTLRHLNKNSRSALSWFVSFTTCSRFNPDLRVTSATPRLLSGKPSRGIGWPGSLRLRYYMWHLFFQSRCKRTPALFNSLYELSVTRWNICVFICLLR